MAEDKESVKDKLNAKQLLFCQYYVSEETYGNGVRSYCKAYGLSYEDVKQQAQARYSASHLLDNRNISQHINNLLEDGGLNHEFIDKRLLFLISQNEDKGTALQAIKEYNKLKMRILDSLKDKDPDGNFDISLKLE